MHRLSSPLLLSSFAFFFVLLIHNLKKMANFCPGFLSSYTTILACVTVIYINGHTSVLPNMFQIKLKRRIQNPIERLRGTFCENG